MVAYRKGIGDLLAEGQERFLKRLSDEHSAAKPIYDKIVWHPGYFVHLTTDAVPGMAVSSTVGTLIHATEARTTTNKVTGGFAKSGMNISGLTEEQQKEVLKRDNLSISATRMRLICPENPRLGKIKCIRLLFVRICL